MVKFNTQLRHGVADIGVVDLEIAADDEEEAVESLVETVRLWRKAVSSGQLTEGIPPPNDTPVPGA